MDDADDAGFLVCDLSKNVATERDVTFRIWLEGEDEHCITTFSMVCSMLTLLYTHSLTN